MNKNKKYTAYCGLYCLDCIPSNKELFESLNELKILLEDIEFDKYAELKSKTNETFNDYSQFLDVLEEMKKLECTAVCTEGGCKEDCKIRECVKEKQYDGCWECDEFKDCELLDYLKGIHSIEHNLKMIKEYGVENWADKRGKHYNWL
ncbi:MAG: DUF3795 domain-containing protein [Methanobacterium sp.]|uniref:DUF3795 domain-containing protein n=1 Tax=Methanobacterium sp. TaxID=2164 RepID=UPI003D649DBE|nr:DUF3795 domain-containing protein [Methanobacterium sp.]